MDLTTRERRALGALADAGGAWAPARTIAAMARIRAVRVLASLEAKGLITCWYGDGNGTRWKTPRYTFTALGAFLLDIRLDEKYDCRPRWFPGRDGRIDTPFYFRQQAGTLRLNLPDTIADPRPGPVEYLIDMESHERTTDPEQAAKLWSVPIPAKPRRKPK